MRRARGFTLVEVLVALTLLSMVAVALFAAVRSGMRVTEAAEAQAEHNQDMRVVSELLYRTLTGLVPLTTVQSGKRLPHLKGDDRSFTVVVDAPARFRPGGLYEVTFEAVGKGPASQVRMTRRMVHPDLLRDGVSEIAYRTDDPDDERVLLDRASIEFDYFGRSDPRTPPRWHREWRGEWGAPEIVRVQVTEAEVAWPEIHARPQVRQARFQSVRARGFGADDATDEQPLPVTEGESDPELGPAPTPSEDGSPSTGGPRLRIEDVCETPQCLQLRKDL